MGARRGRQPEEVRAPRDEAALQEGRSAFSDEPLVSVGLGTSVSRAVAVVWRRTRAGLELVSQREVGPR